jgi:hypothetical protein
MPMKRFLIIKWDWQKGYKHKSFTELDKALQACDELPDFTGTLVCVFDLRNNKFLAIEGHPKEFVTPEVTTIIGYYTHELDVAC